MTRLLGYRIGCIALLVLLLDSCGQLNAASIIHVPADQPTIQAAINAASNGDVIQVAPGTYVENVNFLGKAIRVASDQGPEVTIIDGNRAGPVVTFDSGETLQSVLSGFTVRNGNAAFLPYDGGGILISYASPTIQGNVITNNTAANSGGGISSSFGSPLIQGNLIRNNSQTSGFGGGTGGGGVFIGGASSAQLMNNTISNNSWSTASGGGVALWAAGTPTIQNNLIANNSAFRQGGGLWIMNQSDAAIIQNVIVGNGAPTGGGVYWLVPSGGRGPFLINNTIYGNPSPGASGLYADGFDAQALVLNNIIVAAPGGAPVLCGNMNDPNPPIFRSNDVYSESGAAYGGICANQTGLNGNIFANPMFVNAEANDFHLQLGSPAIDAGGAGGTPQTDFDGALRPLDGNGDGLQVIDIGAYEARDFDQTPPVTVASPAPPPTSYGWNATDVTVTLSATDAGGTGVANIRYWLTGAQQSGVVVTGNPGSVTITADGITTVNFAAMDKAGNVELSRTLDVAVDRTVPVIAGLPKLQRCGLTPVKHQLVQVAVITASDALSGVATLDVTATRNEPDSGTSSEDVSGDIVISGGTVQLRAEKSPSGTGRVYTIVATARDSAGNTARATGTCTVPN